MNLIGVDAVAVPPRLAPAAHTESVAAYSQLAEEYDGLAHRTTRELERLSRVALGRALVEPGLLQPGAFVVELGAGTGALTAALLPRMRAGRLLLSEPATGMLSRALARLEPMTDEASTTVEPLRATASETLARLPEPPDLIIAGLADPYLSEGLLREAAEVAGTDTRVLVTVPSKAWALEERLGRLGTPIDRTRFRTEDGRVVYSRSLALEPGELRSLFALSGLEPSAAGVVRTEAAGWSPRPEVAWAVGRRCAADLRGSASGRARDTALSHACSPSPCRRPRSASPR